MTTPTDVTTLPSSGLVHIDSLLNNNLPGWNWLTPARNTLYYTFDTLNGANAADVGSVIAAAPTAFNATQQAAATAILARLAQITGISFVAVANGTQADFHFGNANILGASTTGTASSKRSYSSTNGTITSYTADTYIYLDNVEWAGNNTSPTAGTTGYETLLHELGHAMGLKHPFQDGVTLPGAQDNTSNTLMSYTHSGGPYSDYRPYDIAALMFLYGGDGLVGTLGQATSGIYLVGTASVDTLNGGGGNDVLEGDGSNDNINGGNGNDTAVFRGMRAGYTITTNVNNVTVSGPDGTDTLTGVETARFDDQSVALGGGNVNHPPTGAISVTGTLQQGGTLSAVSTLADQEGLGAFTYTWQSSPDSVTWTTIAGAATSSLLLAEAQSTKMIRVQVAYIDGQGNQESATGAAAGPVVNVNDAPTGTVSISGTVQPNSLLSLSQNIGDADGLGAFSYKWQSSPNGTTWTDIASATGTTFTPGVAQQGLRLRALVSYADGHGTAESVPSAATVVVTVPNNPPTGTVAVTGTAKQGQTLQLQNTIADADGLGMMSYRWQLSADGNNWADTGTTGDSFTLQQLQVGRLLRVVASYTDGKGNAESVNSSATTAVVNINDAPTGSVSLTGVVQQGQTLMTHIGLNDPDGLGFLFYRWQGSADGGTSWTDIAGASSAFFSPTQVQVGRNLRVIVSYVDGGGTLETSTSAATVPVLNANDPPTGTVQILGAPTQGQVLTANASLADPDGLGPISFQWQSVDGFSFTNIAGATGSTFTPTQAQVGRLLRVVASYTDGGGSAESVTGTTGSAVLNVNDVPTGSVTITGIAKTGQLLTASAASLADADGLGVITFEWQSSIDGTTFTKIAGATASTFTPGNAEVGSQLRVLARYTDGQGTAESVPSAATVAVPSIINGTANKDTLTGTATADEISGLAGDDRLTGNGGNDVLIGGDGIDTAAYGRARADYKVGPAGASVQALAGTEGTDTLQQLERISFSDLSLAFDLNGQAGLTARIIGAVFGAASVSNTHFVAIGLQLLGTGISNIDLVQMALEERLGPGFSNAAEINLLYQNIAGITPAASDVSFWLGTLSSGQFTPASLALMAANLDANASNIDLVGLAASGLGFAS